MINFKNKSILSNILMMYTSLSFAISFLIVLIILPYWIRRAREHNLVSRDVHKLNSKPVADIGGIIVSFGAIIGILLFIAVTVFIKKEDSMYYLLAAVSSLLIATLIGLVDDILGWKIGLRQYQKALLSVLIALPIVVINAGNHTMNLLLFGHVDLGLFYPLLLIPIGIMGASNGFNMLAGYNGLEAGMGIIILSALGFLAWVVDKYPAMLIAYCFVAALLAFIIFNKYPAKVFGGNTLTYSVGAAIAIVAILGDLEKFAVILFIPYFFEFVLKMRGLLQKESFAKPLKDGSLINRYNKWYGVEHIAVSFLRTIKGRAFEYEVVALILFTELVLAFITVFIVF